MERIDGLEIELCTMTFDQLQVVHERCLARAAAAAIEASIVTDYMFARVALDITPKN